MKWGENRGIGIIPSHPIKRAGRLPGPFFLRPNRYAPKHASTDTCYDPSVADRQERTDSAVKERTKLQNQEPAQYKVLLLNDDYTTMEFVVRVLESVFQKSPAEAFRIMLQVHQNGRGMAGVYPWEVAETKVETVTSLARREGFPLKATIEEG